MKNNKEIIEMIMNYEGKSILEQAITDDVKQRIKDWMRCSQASVNDAYINSQVRYFQSCIKVLNS